MYKDEFQDLENIRKELYKLNYYFEKVREQLSFLIATSNTTSYKYGGKAGYKIEEEVIKELEEKKK